MFDWITGFLQGNPYLGVGVLMFAENIFPPIPSEIVMPLAGFNAARGMASLWGVVLAGSFGSLLGALFWYGVGRWISPERFKRWTDKHGRWLTIRRSDVDDVDAWFDRHGGKAVLFGRLVPAVRTLISVPAGMSGMSVPRFLVYSSLGTLVWTAFLAVCGYFLGENYDLVQQWMNPVSNGVVGVIALIYLYRVVTFRPRAATDQDRVKDDT